MKIFDLNVHLTYSDRYSSFEGTQTSKAAHSLVTESQMSPKDYETCISAYKLEFEKGFESANFMFFNSSLFSNQSLLPIVKSISKSYKHPVFTALVDYRLDHWEETIDNLANIGFKAIKFHPYSQKIVESDWEKILSISQYAAKKKFIIFVCTSFGTSVMHKHDGMGLACRLAEYISEVPIVLLHSGGIKIYEAMLLAEDKANVYLDTSFSLNYLDQSPLMDDFAYAYRKIGFDRILYGSDFPYISFEESTSCIDTFFKKYKFGDSDIRKIMYDNASKLFSFE